MTVAERRYEYREKYRSRYDYGQRWVNSIEKKPERTKEKKVGTFGTKEKARIVMLMFVAGLAAVGLIILTAYSAKVQYNINNIVAQCNKTKGEIQTISLNIKTCTNIQTIEDRAMYELGMIYPKYENTTYLVADGKGVDGGIKLLAGE